MMRIYLVEVSGLARSAWLQWLLPIGLKQVSVLPRSNGSRRPPPSSKLVWLSRHLLKLVARMLGTECRIDGPRCLCCPSSSSLLGVVLDGQDSTLLQLGRSRRLGSLGIPRAVSHDYRPQNPRKPAHCDRLDVGPQDARKVLAIDRPYDEAIWWAFGRKSDGRATESLIFRTLGNFSTASRLGMTRMLPPFLPPRRSLFEDEVSSRRSLFETKSLFRDEVSPVEEIAAEGVGIRARADRSRR